MQGAAIMAAVAVVVLVTAVNNYQKEQQFRALNQLNEDVKVGHLLRLCCGSCRHRHPTAPQFVSIDTSQADCGMLCGGCRTHHQTCGRPSKLAVHTRPGALRSKRSNTRQVRVVRGGMERTISTYDLLVGDVLVVDTGDILPADGLLFESSNLRCAQTHEKRCCASCWSTCLHCLSGTGDTVLVLWSAGRRVALWLQCDVVQRH